MSIVITAASDWLDGWAAWPQVTTQPFPTGPRNNSIVLQYDREGSEGTAIV